MNEYEAVEALNELGLTAYEAKVFIALQQLGTGSARDVAQTVDVPRPQVYTTTEALEEQGLVDIQQSTPITYRPVKIEEAKAKLRAQFEQTQETAFEYIERIQTEERADVWTVTGRETIDFRTISLIKGAKMKVLFGIPAAALLQDEIIDTLISAAKRDLSVTIISQDGTIANQFADVEGIEFVDSTLEESEETSGRLLVVDDNTVLLSVFNDSDQLDISQETAIWSAETGFANVLVRLIESYLN